MATTTLEGTADIALTGDATFVARTGKNRTVIGTSQDRLYVITRDGH
ncbi:MAG TPA: hypothetical protein GX512_06790 [Firmicutes bacterium]|nr:hypothetical protein [Candidatus Fermentithermobacillaceae bacterium]